MDTVSPVLFNIDHAEVDMGDYTIRFWKGDYGSTARCVARTIPATCMTAFLIGMTGGEVGLYNNDGRGIGKDGGSLMSKNGLKALGIINVRLNVREKNGNNMIASIGGLRAWPNAYNIFNHSKKGDIYTETKYLFTDSTRASEFEALFMKNIPDKYAGMFKTKTDGSDVTIIWGAE